MYFSIYYKYITVLVTSFNCLWSSRTGDKFIVTNWVKLNCENVCLCELGSGRLKVPQNASFNPEPNYITLSAAYLTYLTGN